MRAPVRHAILQRPPEGRSELASQPNDATNAPPSAAEQQLPARIGGALFRKRSWLPVPFVLVLLLVPGRITLASAAAGLVLIVAGEAWRLWAVAAAGTVTRRRGRRVQTLVTHGPFALNRNPLYTGNLAIWLGMVTFSGVPWFLPIAAALFALEYYFIIRYEEGVLESFFGATYLEYKARTPRWLPRPGRNRVAGPLRWGEAWRSETSTFLQYAALLAVFAAKQHWLQR